ncbi:hypothetical protein JVU11DRAFT_10371 [Chiua virens]|nr:hypothetical protein JVU11DRAFT_10371 [Chiua virens]
MAEPSSHEIPLALSPAQFPMDRTDSDQDVHTMHSSRTPSTSSGSVDFPLLPADTQSRTPRSHTVSPTFVSSPLNPNTPVQQSIPPSLFPRSRTQSRQSMLINRVPSEESQALTSHRTSLTPHRASMILYRLAGTEGQSSLSPPSMNRNSLLSNSGDSILTVSYDSKYPSGSHTPNKFIAYPFDPSLHIDTPEDDDALHDPSDNTPVYASRALTMRGFVNIGVLVLVIIALLCLFIFYPIWYFVVEGNDTTP